MLCGYDCTDITDLLVIRKTHPPLSNNWNEMIVRESCGDASCAACQIMLLLPKTVLSY